MTGLCQITFNVGRDELMEPGGNECPKTAVTILQAPCCLKPDAFFSSHLSLSHLPSDTKKGLYHLSYLVLTF